MSNSETVTKAWTHDELEYNIPYWECLIDAVTYAAAGNEQETWRSLARAKQHGPVGDYLWSRLMSGLGHLSKHDEYEEMEEPIRLLRDALMDARRAEDEVGASVSAIEAALERIKQ